MLFQPSKRRVDLKKMEGRPSVVGEGQVRGGGGEEVMKRKEGRVREKMEGGVKAG